MTFVAPTDKSAATGDVSREQPAVRVRLYETVASRILCWIGDHALRPGDKLPPVRELAAALGVSRVTLREALVALEINGAIAVRPQYGTVVELAPEAYGTLETVRVRADPTSELIEICQAVATKLAGLAAIRRTDDDLVRIDHALGVLEAKVEADQRLAAHEHFHACVAFASQNRLLSWLWEETSGLSIASDNGSLRWSSPLKVPIREYHEIANAICARDPARASHAMQEHVRSLNG
jgi:GntR family transcriptional repressor for pyruvate dehydrogenase complex